MNLKDGLRVCYNLHIQINKLIKGSLVGFLFMLHKNRKGDKAKMNSIKKGTERYTEKMIADAPFNKTLMGRITATTTDGYTVEINGLLYTKLLVLNGVSLSINDTVQILAPNGQMNNIYILGKLG